MKFGVQRKVAYSVVNTTEDGIIIRVYDVLVCGHHVHISGPGIRKERRRGLASRFCRQCPQVRFQGGVSADAEGA